MYIKLVRYRLQDLPEITCSHTWLFKQPVSELAVSESLTAQLVEQNGIIFDGKLREFEPHWEAVFIQEYGIKVYH